VFVEREIKQPLNTGSNEGKVLPFLTRVGIYGLPGSNIYIRAADMSKSGTNAGLEITISNNIGYMYKL
jgi:hypothetical protein